MPKGPCIAFDENGKEVAWMFVADRGQYVPYNDEGALYIVTAIEGWQGATRIAIDAALKQPK